jgi:hypothetical protein
MYLTQLSKKSAVLLLVFLSLRLIITLVQRVIDNIFMEVRKSTTVMRKLQMVIIPFLNP